MREQEFKETAALGAANAEAIELTRRHCRNARLKLLGGNSYGGSLLGVPLGLFEIRCEHAPPPRVQSPRATDLAIEFYRANCTSCAHRDGTGELPNLATVSTQRAAVEQAHADAAWRVAQERAARHRARGERRRLVLAGEGHVVRDLGEALNRIDHSDPRVEPLTGSQQQAVRHVLDTARAAPELFRPVLVDSLVELATDTADHTALEALQALVQAGRCPTRQAVSAAVTVLREQRSVEAGRLFGLLGPDLTAADLPDVVDRLIELASGGDDGPWAVPVSTEGLLAASRVDLAMVTGRIVTHLSSDEEQTRQAGADAARALLAVDATRIMALGPPLAASIRGEDAGYAGMPHPAGAALGALAEGWRGEPELTRQIVEAAAATASQPARDQLARVPWFLQRFREPWDASPEATSLAIAFMARRAGGDWGNEAAAHSAEHMRILAGEIPNAVADHIDELLGVILALSEPIEDSTLIATETGLPPVLQDMERFGSRIKRDARRRNLAAAIGRCAVADSDAVLTPVRSIFGATTGDENHDRTTCAAMLEVLKSAVSAETLRDILPTTYTALCHTDPVVRRGGIDLWMACARVADTLPTELTELSAVLLDDTYVIVHRAMLDKIPQLRLPDEVAPRLLASVAGWIATYAQPQTDPHPEVLASALWSLLFLAQQLPDNTETVRWLDFALAYVELCRPQDRERLLTANWPEKLRAHQLWVRAALVTSASPELIDYYNTRREPLLQALFDQPYLLTGTPFADIEPLSTVHGSAHSWRALEPVELLQSAGRWADASTLARRVEADQPPGAEGAPARTIARAIARGAELGEALVVGPPNTAQLSTLTAAADAAVTAVEQAFPDATQDGQVRATLDTLRTAATVAALLLAPTVTDPAADAEVLDKAAERLQATPATHASGAQRALIASAWKIAALLFRYDAALRLADPTTPVLLQAAQRRAQVLRTALDAAPQTGPSNLRGFLTAVEAVGDPAAAETAWRSLATVPAPVSLVGTGLTPRRFTPRALVPAPVQLPRAVCVASILGVPVTDVLVVRPGEVYHLGMTVRLLDVPDWAERCIVEPVTTLGRNALSLPRYEILLADGAVDELGIMLHDEAPLHCGVEQAILAPALDCPLQVRLVGDGYEQVVDVGGLRRLRLRPFDPSRDALTEHEQTDSRLLSMFAALDATMFDAEDVRGFCRLFAACVRAAQTIMFEKVFRRGTRVTEAQFHDELERRLLTDPEIGGRLTRRDPVAGGFDDLLHDDIIAELKVSRGKPITVDDCARYVGQPSQYGVGRGSQLSILVVLDHGRKTAPPGVIENYIDWLKPRLHGLDDPRYPTLVGVLIINTNLPVPSEWSRRGVEAERIPAAREPGR
ncbi:hypothetical protein [Rugosimonospora africana]|uniref:Uncharacterized protein n=1 Tax=Rugosimonospora africana TaxID=556532 RepID=A0A8J3QRJ1_9ACTN|nr:hypothetical protein [Rugosimonospora africana]GIH16155.1 hypothetical protein Raf01_43270 [Rugosimonospora africana]